LISDGAIYGWRLRAGDKVDSPYRDFRKPSVYRGDESANLLAEVLECLFSIRFSFQYVNFDVSFLFSFSPVLYCDSIFSLLERDEMTVELRFLHGIDICYE